MKQIIKDKKNSTQKDTIDIEKEFIKKYGENVGVYSEKLSTTKSIDKFNLIGVADAPTLCYGLIQL